MLLISIFKIKNSTSINGKHSSKYFFQYDQLFNLTRQLINGRPNNRHIQITNTSLEGKCVCEQERAKRRSPEKEPTHINVSVGEIHEFSQQILGKLLCARHYPKC